MHVMYWQLLVSIPLQTCWAPKCWARNCENIMKKLQVNKNETTIAWLTFLFATHVQIRTKTQPWRMKSYLLTKHVITVRCHCLSIYLYGHISTKNAETVFHKFSLKSQLVYHVEHHTQTAVSANPISWINPSINPNKKWSFTNLKRSYINHHSNNVA